MTNERLNRLCAEKVMGWGLSMTKKFWMIDTSELQSPFIKVEDWNPCEDISDAFMLVDKMKENRHYISFEETHPDRLWLNPNTMKMESSQDNHYCCFIKDEINVGVDNPQDWVMAGDAAADTAPLAIVKACLRTVE